MIHKKQADEQSTFSISSHLGVELFCSGPTRTNGFSLVGFEEGQVYDDKEVVFNYILVVLSGKIRISCDYFRNKVIEKETMVFIPKDSYFHFLSEAKSEVLFFAFTTTVIRTQRDLISYFCTNARKFKNSLTSLPVSKDMGLVLYMIQSQLSSKKLKNTSICDVWNSLIFHTIQAFYTRSEVVAFLRPIFSTEADFVTFIESNYIESSGNVTALIQLSGIPYARFHSLFYEKFGMTAKTWLDTKARSRILLMAGDEHITVTDMAKVFNISTQHFCGLCKRLFGCTPRELIAREKEKLNGSDKKDK